MKQLSNIRKAVAGVDDTTLTRWVKEPTRHLYRDFGFRALIRISNGERHNRNTVSIASREACPPTAFVCPEQTLQTRCCATCGACWSTEKTVAFLEH